jgi:hypothetical protein
MDEDRPRIFNIGCPPGSGLFQLGAELVAAAHTFFSDICIAAFVIFYLNQ